MLDAELTPRSARKEESKRSRAAALARQYEGLFLLLTILRAVSAQSLHELYFRRRPAPTTMRQTTRIIGALVEYGLLERQALTGSRSVYRLTSRSYSSSPRVRRRATETIRSPLADHIGSYCWLRASIWAELTAAGYFVGRGRDEVRALRRCLVDQQRAVLALATGAARADAERVLAMLRNDALLTPLFRARCPQCGDTGPVNVAREKCTQCGARPNQVVSELRFECPRCHFVSDVEEEHHARARGCDGVMREVDHLTFDVGWRPNGERVDVILILVDNPERKLREQLQLLPLRIAGQPRVPIVLRSTDPYSVYDPVARHWIAQGDRHRELLRAFSEEGDRRLFPFASTTQVIDVRPELQLRLRVQRKETT